MSQCNWLSNIALGGWVVACILLASNFTLLVAGSKYPCSEYAQHKAQEPYSNEKKSNLHGIAERAQPEAAQPRVYEPNCKQPKDANEADLCEQWRMANAAEEASCISRFQLWLSGFGIFLVLGSLYFTGWAAIAASQAARAATAGNALQARTIDLELRPYVVPDGFVYHWMYVVARPDELESWRISQAWLNAGQTPARNVKTRLNVEAFDVGESPKDIDFPDIGEFDEVANPLGPRQRIVSRLEVPLQKWIDAWEGRKVLYGWAWIEYDGLQIGIRQRTEVCFRLIPKSDPQNRDDFKLIDALTTRFNAMDDECVHKPRTGKKPS